MIGTFYVTQQASPRSEVLLAKPFSVSPESGRPRAAPVQGGTVAIEVAACHFDALQVL